MGRFKLRFALDGILPVIHLAAGGNVVCGWEWRRRACLLLKKLSLGFVVALCGILCILDVVCMIASKICVRGGRKIAGWEGWSIEEGEVGIFRRLGGIRVEVEMGSRKGEDLPAKGSRF